MTSDNIRPSAWTATENRDSSRVLAFIGVKSDYKVYPTAVTAWSAGACSPFWFSNLGSEAACRRLTGASTFSVQARQPGPQMEAMTASLVVQASNMRCIAERCFERSQGIYPLDLETVNPTPSR